MCFENFQLGDVRLALKEVVDQLAAAALDRQLEGEAPVEPARTQQMLQSTMKEYDQWVVWRYEKVEAASGATRWTKVLYQA